MRLASCSPWTPSLGPRSALRRRHHRRHRDRDAARSAWAGSRAVTARDEFNIAAISEFDLKDALHPLLRRWIADLKLNPLRKQVIGADVAVPAALYKIIYDPELNRVNAFSSPMSITAGCRPPLVI